MYDPRTSPSGSHSRQDRIFGNRGSMNLVEREHEINHMSLYSEVKFKPVRHQQRKNSPSPVGSPSRPLLNRRSISPESRAQAIARGRSELMEMVRHMPEASYELSLKDIVEPHYRAENQAPKTEDVAQRRGVRKVKEEESKKFDRNPSFENKGLFLNMVFPFSFKSKKNKKINGGNSGRISPKPEGLKGGGERDWWKRKFTGSSDSDSSRTSNNSASTASSAATGSSNGARERRRNSETTNCWHFFYPRRRSKSAG